MNLLNTVKIQETFRVKATSLLGAATIIAKNLNRDEIGQVAVVKGEEGTFIVVSNIGTSIYRDVIFVESVGAGKYRVEIADIRLSEFETNWLVGGDEAVNSIGYYKSEDSLDVISSSEYSDKLAYWIASDLEEGSIGRMENHIKAAYKKVTMVNGLFT